MVNPTPVPLVVFRVTELIQLNLSVTYAGLQRRGLMRRRDMLSSDDEDQRLCCAACLFILLSSEMLVLPHINAPGPL